MDKKFYQNFKYNQHNTLVISDKIVKRKSIRSIARLKIKKGVRSPAPLSNQSHKSESFSLNPFQLRAYLLELFFVHLVISCFCNTDFCPTNNFTVIFLHQIFLFIIFAKHFVLDRNLF